MRTEGGPCNGACLRASGGQNRSEADSVLGYERYHRDRITVIRDSM